MNPALTCRSIIAITAAVSILIAAPSQAAGKGSKEEAIGVGSGAFVGAIAGGPVGFIIGAAIGAKVGDSMHKKEERIDELQVAVASSNNTVVKLENNVDSLGGEIERLRNVARPELVSLLQAGQYEDGVQQNSTWATGDWNADGEFEKADLLLALQDGGYGEGSLAALAAVPEPPAMVLILAGSFGVALAGVTRKRRRELPRIDG